MYPVFFRVTNSNGCSDTSSYTVIIDSVTYISFSGLELDYCENQDSSILMGSQTGGLFSGLFIKILPQEWLNLNHYLILQT